MEPSSSGLGRLLLKQEITGSNPVGSTIAPSSKGKRLAFQAGHREFNSPWGDHNFVLDKGSRIGLYSAHVHTDHLDRAVPLLATAYEFIPLGEWS